MFSFFFLTQAHFFISTIYKLREDYLSTSLRVSGSDQWHLITASPDPSGHLQPSRSLVLCRIFYCPICHEAQRSVRSASFSEDKKKKKKTQFHLTLCNIHQRPFFRPSYFCPPELFFAKFFLIVADCSKKSLELHKPYAPLFKTWILSRPPVPLKLDSAKRKKQLLNCARSKLY